MVAPSLNWASIQTWLGSQLAQSALPHASAAPRTDQFSTDSRSVQPGDWFVALAGETFDGHAFLDEILAKGAAGFFYNANRESQLSPAQKKLGIAVQDTLGALQAIAHGWRQSLPNLNVIALTGSTGKTTCKEMLGAILRNYAPSLATQASFNNEIGVPKTLLQMLPEHRFAALEFGARSPGNIKFLCEMANPSVVGLINVGITHVGIFGSVEALLKTKLEIFRDSSDHAVQIACADDDRIVEGARATGKKTLTFGRHLRADVRIESEHWNADGSMHLAFDALKESIEVTLPFAHEAYAINAAGAIAFAIAAGIPTSAISAGLATFTGVKGRYQVHRLQGLTLIDDTYNASPDSMIAGLKSLMRTFNSSKKSLVLGDMLELGDESPGEQARVGAFVGESVKPEWLFVVGPEGQQIAKGAAAAGFPAARIASYDSVDSLLAAGINFRERGEILFAKASNGMKLSKLVDQFTNNAKGSEKKA